MSAPSWRSASTRSPIGRSCMRGTPDRRYSPPDSASAAVTGGRRCRRCRGRGPALDREGPPDAAYAIVEAVALAPPIDAERAEPRACARRRRTAAGRGCRSRLRQARRTTARGWRCSSSRADGRTGSAQHRGRSRNSIMADVSRRRTEKLRAGARETGNREHGSLGGAGSAEPSAQALRARRALEHRLRARRRRPRPASCAGARVRPNRRRAPSSGAPGWRRRCRATSQGDCRRCG